MPATQLGVFIEATIRYLEGLIGLLMRLLFGVIIGRLTRTIINLQMHQKRLAGALPSAAMLLFVACFFFALASPTRTLLTLSTAQPTASNQLDSIAFGNGKLDQTLLFEAILLFITVDLVIRLINRRRPFRRRKQLQLLDADRLMLTAQMLVTALLISVIVTRPISGPSAYLMFVGAFGLPIALCAPAWRPFQRERTVPTVWLLAFCFEFVFLFASGVAVAVTRHIAPSLTVVDLRCDWNPETKKVDFVASIYNPTQRLLMPDVEHWQLIITVNEGPDQEERWVQWDRPQEGEHVDPLFLKPGDVGTVRRTLTLAGRQWEGVRPAYCRTNPPPWFEVALTDMSHVVVDMTPQPQLSRLNPQNPNASQKLRQDTQLK